MINIEDVLSAAKNSYMIESSLINGQLEYPTIDNKTIVSARHTPNGMTAVY